MTTLSTRFAVLVGTAGAALALFATPVAVAEPGPQPPPRCSLGQTPALSNCSSPCPGGAPVKGGSCTAPGTVLHDNGAHEATHPGANPHVPIGTNTVH